MAFAYGQYRNSRNAAWECLLEYGINTLPVHVSRLAKALQIKLIPYHKCPHVLQQTGFSAVSRGSDAFSTRGANGVWYVFFDMQVTPSTRIKFTLTHEIAHIILGHPLSGPTAAPFEFRKQNPIETEANVFASRLLAPACVLMELGVHTPEEIMQLCGLSYKAALIRAQRMEVLYRRDRWYTDPLECRVRDQFMPFIKRTRVHSLNK